MEQFLKIKLDAEENLMYMFLIKKKKQFIVVDSQISFIGNKRTLQGENQWKTIILMKPFFLVEVILISGSHSF